MQVLTQAGGVEVTERMGDHVACENVGLLAFGRMKSRSLICIVLLHAVTGSHWVSNAIRRLSAKGHIFTLCQSVE